MTWTKEKPLVFICNKGWRHNEDRGGTMYAVKAYLEEFTKEDDVEMIVKINPAYGIPNVNKLISELTSVRDNMPKLFIEAGYLDYKEMVKFYNKGNVFVAPTRAEAFNIPVAESAACGLMCIATGYGGQTEIIKDKETGFLIDYDMTEVTWEILYESVSWATPKIDDLKQKMRWCYNNKEKVKEMGKNAREFIKEFTWEETAKKILK